MTDDNRLKEVQKVLIANKLKKKLDEIADNTATDDKSVTDPLKRAKAIIKYYGQQNRLI